MTGLYGLTRPGFALLAADTRAHTGWGTERRPSDQYLKVGRLAGGWAAVAGLDAGYPAAVEGCDATDIKGLQDIIVHVAREAAPGQAERRHRMEPAERVEWDSRFGTEKPQDYAVLLVVSGAGDVYQIGTDGEVQSGPEIMNFPPALVDEEAQAAVVAEGKGELPKDPSRFDYIRGVARLFLAMAESTDTVGPLVDIGMLEHGLDGVRMRFLREDAARLRAATDTEIDALFQRGDLGKARREYDAFLESRRQPSEPAHISWWRSWFGPPFWITAAIVAAVMALFGMF